MIPVAPHLRLEINDRRIGMLSEFTERTDCDLVPVRSIGVNPPSAIIAGTLHYTVTLRRVLLDNVTVPEPFDLHSLHDFTLKICGDAETITFGGCEFASISMRNSVGVSLMEESVVQAASRTVGTGQEG